ncbi:MmgE/PrpD family protein [Jiella sonneratiae]|uniref:MmgE/PrpD family protein n=1 Tax=Jiella sonneratiae TaxID=2816856 RepID=A0ABS3JBX7_9HYPH|nr:MmgE/PrpD family protein [Jiella sonneratiae]MBO0906086.1 MmgE/PrpD family protein [Jiella sonneratiae]
MTGPTFSTAEDGRSGGESAALARYAAGLGFDDLPEAVVDRAKECLTDTVGIALRGRDMPWSRIALDFVRSEASKGGSRVIGRDDVTTAPQEAAFVNGIFAHALELDSLRKPGAGVHPGAIVAAAALAAAQDKGVGGRELLAAIVAGFEVLLRIGVATRHSAEPRGFHAPGLTGPFGAAAAAGRIYGLSPERMTMAFGIAGSTAGGLMQFSAEGRGAMVKRFHIGRAAESGVLAARLAAMGYEGPSEILEGRKGFLATYCQSHDVAALTDGLGTRFETLNLCLKRYPCHITAHTPVYAVECLRRETGLAAGQVASVKVVGTDRMAGSNADQAPGDPALANYSIPFCVAAALTGEPDDPASFDAGRLEEPALRDLCRRIEVVSDGRSSHSDWTTTTIVSCRDGSIHERTVEEFPGTPAMPLSGAALKRRFEIMSIGRDPQTTRDLFARLSTIERETSVDWIH